MSRHQQGIVVLGMPRSGTTLLRRLLDAHPRICCPGETFMLRACARFIQSERIASGIEYGVLGGLRALGVPEQEIIGALRRLCFDVLEQLAQRDGKPRWATKTAVDSFYLEAIERIYGEHVSFIVVVRHGLDVVCSLQEFVRELGVHIAELHAYVVRYPRPLEAFAHAWANVTSDLLGFAARNPNAVLVRYEDLVSQPEETLRRVFAFIGESWQASMIEAAFRKAEVKGLGDWKGYGTAGINGASIGRWRGLPQAMVADLAAIVGPVLERCGYPAIAAGCPLAPDAAMRHYELAMMWKAIRARDGAASDQRDPASDQ